MATDWANQRRNQLVEDISSLFPADAEYTSTAKKGQELLMKAIFENWRSLPIEILETYSTMCKNEDRNYFHED